MAAMRSSLGRQFGWLWVAFAVSTFGTWLAFDAFALIAIIVLHSGPTAVSALAAAGRVVGAAVAVPLGPWVEFRDKRPRRFRVRLARLRPASDRVGHRRRSRHRVQGGQRPLSEDAGAAGGPAGCWGRRSAGRRCRYSAR